jgi:DegV family protein with EDD domain
MTVKIVTDSTSDLTPEVASELGITVVPLYVNFDNAVYRDGVDMTTSAFYRRLAENHSLPTTAAPAPGAFAEVYNKLAKETDEIVVITISSRLSATYKAAEDGKELANGKAQIEVLDSFAAIGGLGLIAISAAKVANAGGSIDDVVDKVLSAMDRVEIRMAFDTLEYLKKGGRIGTAAAFFGSVLKINPILGLKDGLTDGVARVRCRAKAIDYLFNYAASFPGIEELAVEDATTPEETEQLVQRLGTIYPAENIYHLKVSPVIGTHVGPHVLGIGVLPKA